ncbi:MAG: hypothetical protein ACLTMR_00240 [Faecalibacillus sp.]
MYCFSTKTVNLKPVKMKENILSFKLFIKLRTRKNFKIIDRKISNHQNTVLKAVTGAGKDGNDLWCH